MPVYTTNTSTTDYTPHAEYREQVHYLRRSEGSWGLIRAGMVIAEPEENVIGDGKGDDTIFVLEGVAEVRTEEGEEVTLRAGDFVSFPRGVPQVWNITETFRAVFFYAE
jgi:uncharacterized cupin superfamily protein